MNRIFLKGEIGHCMPQGSRRVITASYTNGLANGGAAAAAAVAVVEDLAASTLKPGVTPAQDYCTPQCRESPFTLGIQLQTANPASITQLQEQYRI